MKNILVTGFQPFSTFSVNPSEQVASSLDGALPGFHVHKLVLPVIYRDAENALSFSLKKIKPDYIFLMGLLGNAKCIHLERQAKNLADSKEPDNAGVIRCDERITYAAPDVLTTSFPIKSLCQQLKEENINVNLSDDAGAYLCNFIYFSTLRSIAEHTPKAHCIFLHLPQTTEMQNDRGEEQDKPSNTDSLSLEALTKAVSRIIQTCIKSIQD